MSGEADAFRRMHMERMMAQRQQHGEPVTVTITVPNIILMSMPLRQLE
jgi:hypothetical protein